MKPPALTMNLCNLPPWAIASPHFNRNPQPIEIQGVRRAHRFLFDRLERVTDPGERAAAFHDYMDVAFQLGHWDEERSALGRKSLRNSYRRYLRGWMFDANSIEGAALKGWVESRIGIPPTFHREPIEDIHTDAYARYMADRTRAMARTSAIFAQLDVLYEFVQTELRRTRPGQTSVTLYRGVHDFSEHRILEETGKDRCLLRLNNLNSFTANFERAWEFGTRVLEAVVPLPKVFFEAGLLPGLVAQGEEELLVIGGDYEVTIRRG
jgi:NAD+--dinitrogen-reductase ADP-D-ribosyltransferase